MEDIIIVGNSSHAQLINRYIKSTNFGKVVAYVVDKEYISADMVDGIPVISFGQLKEQYAPENVNLVMGIGYKKMGEIRKTKFEQCKKMGYSFANYIHPTAILPENLIIGEGNIILENVLVEIGVQIGDANLFFGGSIIGHESEIGSYNTFSLRSVIAGNVHITDNCFLGVASAVKDNVTFSNHVLLGATGYGFKDMDAYSVVVPAKSSVLEGKRSTEYI